MERPVLAACPTVVGSFPHREPTRLLDQIFRSLPEMPAWPQLPARDFRESMYTQYSEGLPGAVIDAKNERIHFSTQGRFHEELEGFYQAIVEEDVERFAISREYALGLHLFLDRLRSSDAKKPLWLKGQVTGPFSFAMTVTDENKRSIAYSTELNEIAVQGIAMKARWSARRLRELADNALIVLDEPYLCSFGSAFINVPREDVITAINTSVEAIHKESALAGLHCCGNTDWSLPLNSTIDVINMDAYEFFNGLPLYPAEVKSYMDRGGILSLGIVPTSEIVMELNAQKLYDALRERADLLVAKGIDRAQINRQSLITPACGLGSKSEAISDQAMHVLVELSAYIRERSGF